MHPMQAPKAGAAEILQRRFPVPRLVDCDQNGSQVCLRTHASLNMQLAQTSAAPCSPGPGPPLLRRWAAVCRSASANEQCLIKDCACLRRRASCWRG